LRPVEEPQLPARFHVRLEHADLVLLELVGSLSSFWGICVGGSSFAFIWLRIAEQKVDVCQPISVFSKGNAWQASGRFSYISH
jgi:hypothetical protein